jgi:hypothetical protein
LTKTQIGILWGLSALVVVVFAVLAQMISRAPARPAAPTPAALQTTVYRLPEVPFSARGYYPRADQAARTWQGDAQLVSATATWDFAEIDDLSRPVDWTFQFYSPGTQQLYVVNVGEARATPLVGSLSPYELPTIAPGRWRADSYDALSAWLNEGGATFLGSHSVVDVNARIRQAEEGRIEWSVVGVARDQDEQHVVVMDAETGRVGSSARAVPPDGAAGLLVRAEER